MQRDVPSIPETTPAPTRTVLMRGLRGRCPRCGDGRLFRGYMTQVAECAQCGEKTGDIRADDGPAWLTILVVGHLLAPFFGYFALREDWPEWMGIAILLGLAVGLAILLLPRAKGVFIAGIWLTNRKTPTE